MRLVMRIVRCAWHIAMLARVSWLMSFGHGGVGLRQNRTRLKEILLPHKDHSCRWFATIGVREMKDPNPLPRPQDRLDDVGIIHGQFAAEGMCLGGILKLSLFSQLGNSIPHFGLGFFPPYRVSISRV
jgi:hypothetical protein